MHNTFQLPEESRLRGVLNTDDRSAESALRNFRYVVASVNGDAQKVWAELWNELNMSSLISGQQPQPVSDTSSSNTE